MKRAHIQIKRTHNRMIKVHYGMKFIFQMTIQSTLFDYKNPKAGSNLSRFTIKPYFDKVIDEVFVNGNNASS